MDYYFRVGVFLIELLNDGLLFRQLMLGLSQIVLELKNVVVQNFLLLLIVMHFLLMAPHNFFEGLDFYFGSAVFTGGFLKACVQLHVLIL